MVYRWLTGDSGIDGSGLLILIVLAEPPTLRGEKSSRITLLKTMIIGFSPYHHE